MWFMFTLITFCCWGIADLFYKLGNKEEYSHVKTGIIVGFVMGIHAIIYLIVNKVNINFVNNQIYNCMNSHYNSNNYTCFNMRILFFVT